MTPGGNARSLFCFGLGYTGQALGRALRAQGWRVSGTSREARQCRDLAAAGLECFAFDGSATGYDHTPTDQELTLTPPDRAAYLHYCSNNTIYGTRFPAPPTTEAPLICDASSEMFSRPIDVGRHALVYAGAQKNLGPSGVTLVIIRRDFRRRHFDFANFAKQTAQI